MDEKRYNEVCKLLASLFVLQLAEKPVDIVLYKVVRRLTFRNDDMRDKVKDYAKRWIESQKNVLADIDVDERLDSAMQVYDKVFYEDNPCVSFLGR